MCIRQPSGFTLLEMLIALAIFSVVSMAAGSLLFQAIEAQSVTTRFGDRLLDLERGLHRLSQDLAQYVAKPVRDEFGDSSPAMLLAPGSLELTRRGWANPAGHRRSELQRVRYWVEEGALHRGYWDVLDRAPDSPMRHQTILEHVAWIDFQPITAAHILRGDGMTLAEQQYEPPVALRVLLEVDGYGEIMRIMDLPGEMQNLSASDSNELDDSGAPDAGAAEEAEDVSAGEGGS